MYSVRELRDYLNQLDESLLDLPVVRPSSDGYVEAKPDPHPVISLAEMNWDGQTHQVMIVSDRLWPTSMSGISSHWHGFRPSVKNIIPGSEYKAFSL